jgi:hypothetical protein
LEYVRIKKEMYKLLIDLIITPIQIVLVHTDYGLLYFVNNLEKWSDCSNVN